jgi:hypothetical protein
LQTDLPGGGLHSQFSVGLRPIIKSEEERNPAPEKNENSRPSSLAGDIRNMVDGSWLCMSHVLIGFQ